MSPTPPAAMRLARRRRDDDAHGVQITDTPEIRVRHPSDLLRVVLSAVGVALVMLLVVYAHGTTEGLSTDVVSFTSVLATLLGVPIYLLEGLVTVVIPVMVLAELTYRRLPRQLFESIAGAAGGLLLGVLTNVAVQTWGSAELISGFSVRSGNQSVLTIPSYVAAVSALLLVAGPRHRRRTLTTAWNLLWIALGVTVITVQVSLTGALVVVLLGRVAGLGVRYLSGTWSERAYGRDLVAGLRRAGFQPVRLVRVPAEAEAGEGVPTGVCPHGAAVHAMARSGDNRVYVMVDADGEVRDVAVLDGDRQVIGLLQRLWRSIRLRGIDGRAVVSLRQAAERAALLGYAARAAGVNAPKLLGMAEAEDSMLLVYEHLDAAVPLRDLPAEAITEEVLENVWGQIRVAHAAGLAHRALTSDVVLVDGSRVWLAGWEYGDVASSDLSRRMDLTQVVALLALRVGATAAVTSATQVMRDEDLAAVGPLLQTVALPRATREEAREHKEVLDELRSALVQSIPEADVEPERLRRFDASTVLTLTLSVVAAWVIVTTVNFQQIQEALASASPWWAVAGFAFGLLTFVGAGLALVGFAPVRLPVRTAVLTQAAAAFVTLAAPAGVGPAALNLRVLTKRGVTSSLAVATVALVQVSGFVVTIGLLAALSATTGSSGALRALPSGTVLAGLAVVAVVVGAMMLVPPVRQWVAAKTLPTLRQTWPRLVSVLGQPGKLALGLGGNLLVTVAFLFAFYAALAAFGRSMPLIDLAVIYLVGNTIGAAVPTPGGVGTIELALIGGLSGAGIPPAIATSVAVLFRVMTYWGRVPLGWLAMRYLQRRGEL